LRVFDMGHSGSQLIEVNVAIAAFVQPTAVILTTSMQTSVISSHYHLEIGAIITWALANG